MPVLSATPASPFHLTSAPRVTSIRILADDLTGACDSAAAFLASGHTVRVWLGDSPLFATSESVQAFNTASRDLTPHDAAAAVATAAAALSASPETLVFKKVDSAARGHIAAEVLAAHHALGTRAVLFAPSFPAVGRTVRDGILRIEDESGVMERRLLSLFRPAVRTAQISIPGQIPNALDAGFTVLVCDACTPDDLDALATLDIPDLLYAGSAGLAQSLAKIHPAEHPAAPKSLPRIAAALTICGTPHSITRLQTEHLLTSNPSHPQLHIRAEADDAPAILGWLHHHTPDALILTGGDTALLVLQTLKAHSIFLCGELAPGIPWGVIQGGLAHGRIVVTKSGGFGHAHTLTGIVQTLTGVSPA